MLIALFIVFLVGLGWLAVLGAGAVIVWRGVRGRPVDEHARCRRCRYDLSGAPRRPRLCPECGANLLKPGRVLLGRNRPVGSLITIGSVIVVGNLSLAALAWWLGAVRGVPAPAAVARGAPAPGARPGGQPASAPPAFVFPDGDDDATDGWWPLGRASEPAAAVARGPEMAGVPWIELESGLSTPGVGATRRGIRQPTRERTPYEPGLDLRGNASIGGPLAGFEPPPLRLPGELRGRPTLGPRDLPRLGGPPRSTTPSASLLNAPVHRPGATSRLLAPETLGALRQDPLVAGFQPPGMHVGPPLAGSATLSNRFFPSGPTTPVFDGLLNAPAHDVRRDLRIKPAPAPAARLRPAFRRPRAR